MNDFSPNETGSPVAHVSPSGAELKLLWSQEFDEGAGSSVDRTFWNFDIGDVIAVHYTITPSFGGIEQSYTVEGMERLITAAGEHLVTLFLGDVDAASLFILDDTSTGVLDTSALSY